ncbi:MAG: uracil-DNA glycosylase [bacterium]|nr:uracil-DNA glycosylase [bacterium]
MPIQIEQSWKHALQDEFEKPYFKELSRFVKHEYQTKTVFPPLTQIFSAFSHTPFNQVKVVILGQDPYHGSEQANGLCFSVAPGVRFPPSLQNIFKEIIAELGGDMPESGDLTHWADQGVLLLNSTLTVEAKKAGSHQRKGWEEFTDSAIRTLAEEREGLVFMLWGAYARKKGAFINRKKHLVLESPHPSPFSAHTGFFGNGHFKVTNDYLLSKLQTPIGWLVETKMPPTR